MALHYVIVMLYIVRLVTSSVGTGGSSENYDDLQRRFKTVIKEVEDLKSTLNSMQENVKRSKKISQAFDAFCAVISSEESPKLHEDVDWATKPTEREGNRKDTSDEHVTKKPTEREGNRKDTSDEHVTKKPTEREGNRKDTSDEHVTKKPREREGNRKDTSDEHVTKKPREREGNRKDTSDEHVTKKPTEREGNRKDTSDEHVTKKPTEREGNRKDTSDEHVTRKPREREGNRKDTSDEHVTKKPREREGTRKDTSDEHVTKKPTEREGNRKDTSDEHVTKKPREREGNRKDTSDEHVTKKPTERGGNRKDTSDEHVTKKPTEEQSAKMDSIAVHVQEKAVYHCPLQFQSLQTEVDGMAYSFQMNYTMPGNEVTSVSVITKSEIVDFTNSVVNDKGAISVRNSRRSDFNILLFNSHMMTYINFHVVNESRIDIPPVMIALDREGEIVFEEGETLVINVKIQKNELDYRQIHSHKMYILRSNGTDFTLVPGTSTPKAETSESREYALHFNTTEEDYGGIITIGYLLLCKSKDKTCALSNLGIGRFIHMRRAENERPFPAGFLGFLGKHDQPMCKQGEDCIILVVNIAGSDPEDITLRRVEENGTKEKEDFAVRLHFYKTDCTMRAVYYIPNITGSDAGRYAYRVTSGSGAVIEREFEVKVSYTLFKDSSRLLVDMPRRLVLQCSAKGFPPPRIIFYNQTGTKITEGNGTTISTETDDHGIITSTLRINGDHRHIRRIQCGLNKMRYDDITVYNKYYRR